MKRKLDIGATARVTSIVLYVRLTAGNWQHTTYTGLQQQQYFSILRMRYQVLAYIHAYIVPGIF